MTSGLFACRQARWGGFVEAIANGTLLAIRDRLPRAMRGTAVMTAVLEASSAVRVGRFRLKSQHASLESFAADAYLNETGITTPLLPDENPSSGRDHSAATSCGYCPKVSAASQYTHRACV
jgi:CxxC motif-containing protein (DUF1111 family)